MSLSPTKQLKRMLDQVQVPTMGTHKSMGQKVTVFGMCESGKTTVLGFLELTCIDLTNRIFRGCTADQEHKLSDLGKNFYFYVEERTSGIRQASSDLRDGMFPVRTPMDHAFEAIFKMRFHETLGKQMLEMPFGELAGEEFTKLISRFQNGQYELTPDTMVQAGALYDYVLCCDGAVIIAPVTRALGTEEEKGSKVRDPDLNIARLLDVIYKYRQANHLPPLKGIAVLLTKYDALQKFLCEQGMDLSTKEGTDRFMATYFKESYAVLKWYGLERVKFWPTWVALETEKDQITGQLVAVKHSKRDSWKIKVDKRTRIPEYSQDTYRELILWLKETFVD